MKGTSHRIGWTTVAAGFGFGLVQLDVTIVNVALPAMAKALGSNVSGLQWVVDAYALVFAAVLLSAGFLGDRYGARKIYLGGIGLFAAASLGCGLAPNAAALIGARALQGLGAAAMLPCSLALINHAVRCRSGDRSRKRSHVTQRWRRPGMTIIESSVSAGMTSVSECALD